MKPNKDPFLVKVWKLFNKNGGVINHLIIFIIPFGLLLPNL